MECTYAIACKSDNDNVSCCTQFDPHGNGEKLWKDLAENGKLTDASTDEKLKGMAHRQFGAAILLFNCFVILLMVCGMHTATNSRWFCHFTI